MYLSKNASLPYSLKRRVRIKKAKPDKVIPEVAYWPWGQAFALLKAIVELLREAMNNRFFWQGIRTDEDALITGNAAVSYVARIHDIWRRPNSVVKLLFCRSIVGRTHS